MGEKIVKTIRVHLSENEHLKLQAWKDQIEAFQNWSKPSIQDLTKYALQIAPQKLGRKDVQAAADKYSDEEMRLKELLHQIRRKKRAI